MQEQNLTTRWKNALSLSQNHFLGSKCYKILHEENFCDMGGAVLGGGLSHAYSFVTVTFQSIYLENSWVIWDSDRSNKYDQKTKKCLTQDHTA